MNPVKGYIQFLNANYCLYISIANKCYINYWVICSINVPRWASQLAALQGGRKAGITLARRRPAWNQPD